MADIRENAVYPQHLISIMIDSFRNAQLVLKDFGIRLCDYPGDLAKGRLQVYEGIEILAELWGEQIETGELGKYTCLNMEHDGVRYFQLEDKETP